MKERFQDKYRIQSTRAPWWDYGSNGAYYVTICTKNRVHYFGEISEQETQDFASQQYNTSPMKLTEIGKIAQDCWQEIPQHFPFVKLGAFVVMPNHVHGIVIIDKPGGDELDNAGKDVDLDTGNGDGGNAETQNFTETQNVETQNIASLPPEQTPSDHDNIQYSTNQPEPKSKSSQSPPKNQFGPQSQNLASIIRGFKTGVTKRSRPIDATFEWQPLYDDRIIRNNAHHYNIAKYIENNPLNWNGDEFNDG